MYRHTSKMAKYGQIQQLFVFLSIYYKAAKLENESNYLQHDRNKLRSYMDLMFSIELVHRGSFSFQREKKRINFSQILLPRNQFSSFSQPLLLSRSICFCLIFINSQSSHNFKQSWIEKKSLGPSQMSLFLTLLCPNITHFLSRGVKGRSLKEVSRKERKIMLEGPHLSEGRGQCLAYSTNTEDGPQSQHIRVTCCIGQGSPEKQSQQDI